MKYYISSALILVLPLFVIAQNWFNSGKPGGAFTLGTINTVSMFNEDNAIGKGIGAQFRIWLGNKLNSQWYFDYITSKEGSIIYRNDYHIGWSLMFYLGNNFYEDKLLQPYFTAGHCFDKSKVAEKEIKQTQPTD